MIRPTDRLDEYIDLWDAVDALPPKCKAVVLLFMIGMTQEETGELLGMDRSNVSLILKKVRNQIKNSH